jgi:hypothetical protein
LNKFAYNIYNLAQNVSVFCTISLFLFFLSGKKFVPQ